MTAELEHVLEKMCQMAGVDYYEVDFKDPFWYQKHSWTKQQEEAFVAWLSDLLYNSKATRTELMRYPIKDKQLIKRTVSDFIGNWGWKTEEDGTKSNKKGLSAKINNR